MSPIFTRATICLFGVLSLAACRIVTAQNSDPHPAGQSDHTPADRDLGCKMCEHRSARHGVARKFPVPNSLLVGARSGRTLGARPRRCAAER